MVSQQYKPGQIAHRCAGWPFSMLVAKTNHFWLHQIRDNLYPAKFIQWTCLSSIFGTVNYQSWEYQLASQCQELDKPAYPSVQSDQALVNYTGGKG